MMSGCQQWNKEKCWSVEWVCRQKWRETCGTVLYTMNRVITACTPNNFAKSKIWTKRWQQCRDDSVVKAHLCKWWPGLGLVISDAMYTWLLNDAVIGAEMMKITAIKAIMTMVDFLWIHTTGYDTFSGREAMQAQRIRNGWYRNQYGLYCKSGQKGWTILY